MTLIVLPLWAVTSEGGTVSTVMSAVCGRTNTSKDISWVRGTSLDHKCLSYTA